MVQRFVGRVVSGLSASWSAGITVVSISDRVKIGIRPFPDWHHGPVCICIGAELRKFVNQVSISKAYVVTIISLFIDIDDVAVIIIINSEQK